MCSKVIYWVGVIKNEKQPIRLAPEYMNFFWLNLNNIDR
jgi:hypothetical protein